MSGVNAITLHVFYTPQPTNTSVTGAATARLLLLLAVLVVMVMEQWQCCVL